MGGICRKEVVRRSVVDTNEPGMAQIKRERKALLEYKPKMNAATCWKTFVINAPKRKRVLQPTTFHFSETPCPASTVIIEYKFEMNSLLVHVGTVSVVPLTN